MTRLSDEARRFAFAKPERLEAARASVGKLTDDECPILYVEIEARLAHATETLTTSVAAETQPELVDAPPELPFAEAKRLAAAAFERNYLARLMVFSKDSVTEAARLAHVDRTNFRRLLQRSGLRPRGLKTKKTEPAAKYTDQIIVCAEAHHARHPFIVRPVPIVVPPLRTRTGELVRIVDEYAAEAVRELDADITGFSTVDRDWILLHSASSLPEIERGTRRLVAVRQAATLHQAAARLGIRRETLSRWLGQRRRGKSAQ